MKLKPFDMDTSTKLVPFEEFMESYEEELCEYTDTDLYTEYVKELDYVIQEGRLINEAIGKGKNEKIVIKIIKFLPRLIIAIVKMLSYALREKGIKNKLDAIRRWCESPDNVSEAARPWDDTNESENESFDVTMFEKLFEFSNQLTIVAGNFCRDMVDATRYFNRLNETIVQGIKDSKVLYSKLTDKDGKQISPDLPYEDQQFVYSKFDQSDPRYIEWMKTAKVKPGEIQHEAHKVEKFAITYITKLEQLVENVKAVDFQMLGHTPIDTTDQKFFTKTNMKKMKTKAALNYVDDIRVNFVKIQKYCTKASDTMKSYNYDYLFNPVLNVEYIITAYQMLYNATSKLKDSCQLLVDRQIRAIEYILKHSLVGRELNRQHRSNFHVARTDADALNDSYGLQSYFKSEGVIEYGY